MYSSQIKTRYVKHSADRICQGDIFRNIVIIEGVGIENDDLVVTERSLVYAVVLSQDCDLEQDFSSRNPSGGSHDKHIPSILICPAYPAAQVKEGTHLGDEFKMQAMNSALYKPILQNNSPRYHFLEGFGEFQVPELIIDFKHFFTLKRDIFYRDFKSDNYLASISEVFRESLCQRFANYLSRIGLPEISASA